MSRIHRFLAGSLPALVEGEWIDHGALARALHLARDNPAKNTEVQFTSSAAARAARGWRGGES